ncbi:hypothetical protein [Candidatus Protochlamydia phocaeensis]|uniref:hypothetical protein n=1 Tax=Candidatus Protochlamydia phocaeensis TaxID=1414722 RepID=UPI00083976CB|nr:hypothetical protein [Candidatus Protochlamydia phocaeensis]
MTDLFERLANLKFQKKPELTLSEKWKAFTKEISQENDLDVIEKKAHKNKLSEQFKDAFKKINYTIWDAIISWRDAVFNAELTRVTKYNYLNGMLKLIEADIINPYAALTDLTLNWYDQASKKINALQNWAPATKQSRKTCLKSFYAFSLNYDPQGTPHKNPTACEIIHMLSSIAERALTKDIDSCLLLDTLIKLNERDAIIVAVMLFSGKTLEEVLDLRKTQIYPGKIEFKDKKTKMPISLTNLIEMFSKNNNDYVFVTDQGNRIHRTQVIRNLKLASKIMGLEFELTPKVLQGYSIAYFPHNKEDVL